MVNAQEERVLEWDARTNRLVDVPETAETVLVADSWLVTDGAVRALERHWNRFSGGCAAATRLDRRTVKAFWQECLATFPRTGRWFPRVEAVYGQPQRLRLRVRRAPEAAWGVGVWVSDSSDPRRFPYRKGPDLERLATVRQRAVEHGADEALLVTLQGIVLEGAFSSIMWWEDDCLCFPAVELPQLPAVTSGLVKEIADADGNPIAYRHSSVAELSGREVWMTSALHGIRPVTEWIGSPVAAGGAVRVERWKARLSRFAVPLPAAPGSQPPQGGP